MLAILFSVKTMELLQMGVVILLSCNCFQWEQYASVIAVIAVLALMLSLNGSLNVTMRTVLWSVFWGGGGGGVGCILLVGGCASICNPDDPPPGMHPLPLDVTQMDAPPPHVDRMTDTCENITFPILHMQAVIITHERFYYEEKLFGFESVNKYVMLPLMNCVIYLTWRIPGGPPLILILLYVNLPNGRSVRKEDQLKLIKYINDFWS